MNYSKILFEIEEDLKKEFLVYLAKNGLSQKEVLTEYIRKLVCSKESER